MKKELRKLKSREVEGILLKAGFKFKSQRGSHCKYVGTIRGETRKVTIIANQERFAIDTLKSMIRQSGLSEQEWLALK